ncbi:MAG: uncharacterized protein A8A55_2943 [Amphiamblys sp. WSBS2006]|nr:MAG: uncharacterized protein A8A55_2943 [Amphiamblys sp. WSBS2006]
MQHRFLLQDVPPSPECSRVLYLHPSPCSMNPPNASLGEKVDAILGDWAGLQISLEECDGPEEAEEIVLDLKDALLLFFKQKGLGVQALDVEEFLLDFLEENISVVLEDDDITSVSRSLFFLVESQF